MKKSLDFAQHKTNMTNILLAVYKDKMLGPYLGFKGGTAAMFFYGLPRLSVDLGFDVLRDNLEDTAVLDQIIERIERILSRKYQIKDSCHKYNTLFWAVSYGSDLAHIKVEISTRDSKVNTYILKQFYGVTIKVMEAGDMIINKMIALISRKTLANRDIFDIHYFLESKYANEIDYSLVLKLTQLSPREFLGKVIKVLEKVNNNRILDNMGEILTEPQKDWVKAKLLTETIELVKRQRDFLV